jgi:hypothetical protein
MSRDGSTESIICDEDVIVVMRIVGMAFVAQEIPQVWYQVTQQRTRVLGERWVGRSTHEVIIGDEVSNNEEDARRKRVRCKAVERKG